MLNKSTHNYIGNNDNNNYIIINLFIWIMIIESAFLNNNFLNNVAAVINDEDHALAAIGPIYELPDYNWIRRRSYWHRY